MELETKMAAALSAAERSAGSTGGAPPLQLLQQQHTADASQAEDQRRVRLRSGGCEVR